MYCLQSARGAGCFPLIPQYHDRDSHDWCTDAHENPTIVTDDAKPDPLIMNEIEDADEVKDGSGPSTIRSDRNYNILIAKKELMQRGLKLEKIYTGLLLKQECQFQIRNVLFVVNLQVLCADNVVHKSCFVLSVLNCNTSRNIFIILMSLTCGLLLPPPPPPPRSKQDHTYV